MVEERKIRDPVHGFISLTGKEADIVDTRIFQRLRGIRQLAFAHLVYPGAMHTRFEHSLGVCHIAGLMAKALRLSPGEEGLARPAALLHDLGHGPFSHVSETVLELYADRGKLGDRIRGKQRVHEIITEDLIRMDSDLKRLLGESDCEKIAKLLSKGFGEPVLRSIVSGPLDADKQDYLRRDSYFCAVEYGIFDMHQLHREFLAVEDPMDRSKDLRISPDGVHALE